MRAKVEGISKYWMRASSSKNLAGVRAGGSAFLREPCSRLLAFHLSHPLGVLAFTQRWFFRAGPPKGPKRSHHGIRPCLFFGLRSGAS